MKIYWICHECKSVLYERAPHCPYCFAGALEMVASLHSDELRQNEENRLSLDEEKESK